MRAVDTAVLTRLNAISGVKVYPGEMELNDTDGNPRVVSYALPYAVYYSSIGDDDRPRLTGRSARRSVYFRIIYVGIDPNQAKALGEKIALSLRDKVVPVTGHQTWLCQIQESQSIRRDDEAVRSDGSPLFYGADNYALPITLVHTA